jgi:hypothetical protein
VAKVDWLNTLNIAQAVKNCRIDVYGDWYRDPWSWPELEWIGSHGHEVLEQRLNAHGVGRTAILDVPKENFIIRPGVVLDPLDRIMYEAIVDRLSLRLIGEMPPWVYGWRLRREDPAPGVYANRSKEWDRYRHDLIALADHSASALLTDVVSYFASIPLHNLVEELLRRTGHNDIVERLVDMLLSWGRMAGRTGLPQRSNASSVLANMYLRPIDDALQQFGRHRRVMLQAEIGHDVAATRWMDDIWLFGNDPAKLRRAQMHIQDVLGGNGLEINAGKTNVLEGDKMVETVREVELSAVDKHLAFEPPDPEPLGQLVERLVENPEQASATSIKFATHRMRKHNVTDYQDQFINAGYRMPQGSPSLSRLFRDSGRWRELTDWFVEYTKSAWGSNEWAVGQLATMFPSHVRRVRPVDESFQRAVENLTSLAYFGVAAQRLAAWRPATARSLFREIAKRCGDPQQRRVIALAALSAHEETAWVRKLLGEFVENVPTLEMLRARNFRPVKVAPDFQGDDTD